jgi:hypothetical protein
VLAASIIRTIALHGATSQKAVIFAKKIICVCKRLILMSQRNIFVFQQIVLASFIIFAWEMLAIGCEYN